VIVEALSTPLEALRSASIAPVTVAIVDSGVDGAHPDLRGRLDAAWMVREHDGGVVVQEMSRDENNDIFGHGTAVGGIIARLAPNARLVDVRVLDDRNRATGEVLLAGFEKAIESGARIINLSLACKSKFAGRLNALCERAYHNRQTVVAARRNNPFRDMGYPAEISSCISVEISTAGGFCDLAFVGGAPIEFAAEGESVTAPAPGGGYTEVTGTSFATPVVSGLCALMLGAYPELRTFELKTLLKHFGESREEG